MGAGASRDFGLPLWDELRPLLVESIYGAACSNDIVEHWLNVLENSSNDVTVDELAMEARNEEEFDVFRRHLGEIILNREGSADTKKKNWAYLLGEALGNILADDPENAAHYSENLRVVTLNYDRCFIHYLSAGVKDSFSERYKKPRERQAYFTAVQKYIEKAIHPHGCLGQLNKNKALIIQGDKNRDIVDFGGNFNETQVPPVFPVDELHLPAYRTNAIYKQANRSIATADNCFVIGLSPIGIEKSRLVFMHQKEVLYTGKEQVKNNFVPLNLRVNQLIEQMIL